MREIGQFLKNHREQQGLSLDDVSQQTKIGVIALQNLEEGHLEELPSLPFVRGYIVSYSKFLKIEKSDIEDLIQKEFAPEESEKGEATSVEIQKNLPDEKEILAVMRKRFSPTMIVIVSLMAVLISVLSINSWMYDESSLAFVEPRVQQKRTQQIPMPLPVYQRSVSSAKDHPEGVQPEAVKNPQTTPEGVQNKKEDTSSIVTENLEEFVLEQETERTPSMPIWGEKKNELIVEAIKPTQFTIFLDGEKVRKVYVHSRKSLAFKSDRQISLRIQKSETVRAIYNGVNKGLIAFPGDSTTITF